MNSIIYERKNLYAHSGSILNLRMGRRMGLCNFRQDDFMKKKSLTPFRLSEDKLTISKYFNCRFVRFNNPKEAKFWFRRLNDAYRDGERSGVIDLKNYLRKYDPEIFNL